MLGTNLKHYRLDELLGKGGMGEVYRAFDGKLQRPVALKVLPEEFTSNPDRHRRFLQEARAAGSIQHPAIAQIYDVDEVDGVTFRVMELVDGRTVTDLVAARELDVQGAVEVAIQIAHGLAKAHAAGIVHREIKADNIMVTSDGHAKILDFGLAKLLEPMTTDETPLDPAEAPTVSLTQTQAGVVLGTVAFMSPEQARAQPLDHRSDIFSFGVVLYHMVSGQLPFSGHSPIDTLHAIAFDETRPVTQIRSNLPPGLQRAISRCLRKRPADRYADAKEVVEALKKVQQEIETGVTSKISLVERLRERLGSVQELEANQWGLLVLAAAAVGFLFLWLLRQWEWPILLAVAFGGWLCYRAVKNRPRKLARRFASRIKKMPEVRLIVERERQVTVIVDHVVARILVRVKTQIDKINDKWFRGEKFTVDVRDDVTGEELRGLLQGTGVLYVRKDLLEERV